MSEISLGWFFQIPGLFITIGVLLILVALLVLIIGSSKSRNSNDDNKEVSMSVTEPVANPSETVNVVENTNQKVLDANSSTVDNNIPEVNSANNGEVALVVEPLPVNNNDNVVSVAEPTLTIVTPVISENVVDGTESVVEDKVVDSNTEVTSDQVAVDNSSLVMTDAIVGDTVSESTQGTMAPIFSDTETITSNEEKNDVPKIIEPSLKVLNVNDSVEMIDEIVPSSDNVVSNNETIPVENNKADESVEIEEIL